MKSLEIPADVIGVDEAGRGPLAGPVVVCAVTLPEGFDPVGINDSKKLTPADRENRADELRVRALFEIEYAWPDEIDEKNILWATMAAMERAADRLYCRLPDREWRVLIDGNRVPNNLKIPGEAIIKGDGRFAAIAAASILAKTERDRYMREIATTYPGYGFEEHFGYPTPLHFERLKALGPCPIHRKSFAPVANLLDPVPTSSKVLQPCLLIDDL